MHAKGFTLIELLVALLILAILFGIGLPSFSRQLQANQVRATTYQLLDSLQQARTLAATYKTRVSLQPLENWSNGWVLFHDTNHNGKLDADEALVAEVKLQAKVTIYANDPIQKYVSYISNGESRYAKHHDMGAFQAGTFTLCPVKAGDGYKIIIARGGRARLERVAQSQCHKQD